jgi:hypothetical protein
MKRAALPVLLFSSLALVSSAYASAQASPDPSHLQLQAAQPTPGACPVSLRVQQTAAGFTREVGQGNQFPNETAQVLHVTLTDPDSRKIVAASVTVRGQSARGRKVDVLTTDQAPGDAARTMSIRLTPSTAAEVETSLRVPGFSAVNAVELNAVTFADGATWKIAARTCRTPIDGTMLIGMR